MPSLYCVFFFVIAVQSVGRSVGSFIGFEFGDFGCLYTLFLVCNVRYEPLNRCDLGAAFVPRESARKRR